MLTCLSGAKHVCIQGSECSRVWQHQDDAIQRCTDAPKDEAKPRPDRLASAAGPLAHQESALKPSAATKRRAISESSARRRVCSAVVLASRLAAKGVTKSRMSCWLMA